MKDKKAKLWTIIIVVVAIILLLPLVVFMFSSTTSLLPNEIVSNKALDDKIEFVEKESFAKDNKVMIVFKNTLKDELELSKKNLKIIDNNTLHCEVVQISNMDAGVVNVDKINLKGKESGALELKCDTINDSRFETGISFGFKDIKTQEMIQGDVSIDLIVSN